MLIYLTDDYGIGPEAWFGLNDQGQEGVWRHVDGTTAKYTSWYPGEPNNAGGNEDCAAINFNDRGKWLDAPCNSNRKYFVCEKKAM